MTTAYKMYHVNDDVVNLLHEADKPTWGCRCVAITTAKRGTLTYTCAPCSARAHAALQAYVNPHAEQLSVFS